MPIWLYTLSVEPASQSVNSAPVTASGTASSTVNGCTSDSNCAREHHEHDDEREDEREVERVAALLELARFAGERRAAARAAAPRRRSRSSESSASPRVKPGARLAESVTERTRLKWLSCRGPTPSLHRGQRLELHQLPSRPRT